ncbi:hypothetical protein [Salinibacter altiplanensis]|uniref:hypothetical protein n=1 Tax=Salinibacter altiplanensis TaxID=1803181 RepID=UPI000C9FD0D4|nr:hypothetical protein [Salinibacter altiplanensis]
MTNDQLENLKSENPHEEGDLAHAWELGAVDGASGLGMTSQNFDSAPERMAYLDGRVAGGDAAAENAESSLTSG